MSQQYQKLWQFYYINFFINSNSKNQLPVETKVRYKHSFRNTLKTLLNSLKSNFNKCGMTSIWEHINIFKMQLQTLDWCKRDSTSYSKHELRLLTNTRVMLIKGNEIYKHREKDINKYLAKTLWFDSKIKRQQLYALKLI